MMATTPPNETERPAVSVVVTVATTETTVGLALLPRCLTALFAQDLGRTHYEIIVVGIGLSPDQAEGLLALDGKLSRVRAVHEPWSGRPAGMQAAAKNRGLALAAHPLVVCVDAAAVPAPGWLTDLVASFEAGRVSDSGVQLQSTTELRAAGGFPSGLPLPPFAGPATERQPGDVAPAVAEAQRCAITLNPRQAPAPVAVVLPTILRPTLLRAAESVYRQDLAGPIHLLVGVDVASGDPALLDALRAGCPPHVTLTVLDLGYSTSRRHGGLHTNHYSGSLRTILSFAANARHVAYLDDNDWFARDHLSSLLRAIDGKSWAFSLRWLVDEATLLPLARDEWASLGPDRGIDAQRFGGFVSPSTLMLDKLACMPVLPLWSQALMANGTGEDRRVLAALKDGFSWGATETHTSFCTLSEATQSEAHHAREFLRRGVAWFADRTLLHRAAERLAEARTAQEAGRWTEVAKACEEVLAVTAYNVEALRLAATADWKLGRPQQAVRRLEMAVTVDDGSAAPFALLADLLDETGDGAAAHSVRRQTARRFPA